MESALLRWYYSGTYRCISSVAVFFPGQHLVMAKNALGKEEK